MELNLIVKILETIVKTWESNYALLQLDTHSQMVRSKEQWNHMHRNFKMPSGAS
jgi:hypothetical protein